MEGDTRCIFVGENQDDDDNEVSGSVKRFCSIKKSIKKGRSVQFQKASGVVRVLLTTVFRNSDKTLARRIPVRMIVLASLLSSLLLGYRLGDMH
jgi:predicted RND superfamily exporter protein